MTARLLGGAAVCLSVGLTGLYLWEQSEYNTDPGPINKRVWYGYDRTTIIGLMCAVSFLTPGVALLYGAASQHLQQALACLARHDARRHEPSTEDVAAASLVSSVHYALGFYLLLATTFFVLGVVAITTWGAGMMACGVIFCVGNVTTDANAATYKGDPINAGIACMLCLSLCPMGLVMWWRGVRLWLGHRARASTATAAAPAMDPQPGMHRFVPPSRTRELVWMSGYMVLLLFFAFVSFYMPGDTRHFKPSNVASYARLDVAPYATPHNATHTAPELPRAYMRTHSIRLSNAVVLKLYPGNVLFFAYCILLMLTAWGVRQSVTSRYWMSRRFSFYPSLSFGEGILCVSMAVMTILFFVYWTHDHNYKGMWTLGKEEKGYIFTSEILARGFGMLATLLLSFLMFPVSRHSFLHRLLGSSYETILWTHRVLGYGMLIATALHILLFFWAYYNSGQLWNNLNYIPILCCSHLVRNDFVVPVVTWTTYVMLITMGIFALNRFRRRFYEVFYYSHLISTYCMIPVLLWHVASGWQYLVPGVTLWFIDCLVRLFQRSALVDVQCAKVVSEDVVEIGFTIAASHDRLVLQRACPGQYVFLSVAEISALQWHPFTLSSVAGGGATNASAPYTVHIKSMGPGTWTQRLYDRVARGEPLTLAVEGPCGSPLDVSHYDELFLVCGGIGVTPCASIFGSVLRWARAQAQADATHIAESAESADSAASISATLPHRVKLIWACRSAQLVQAMAPTLGLPESLHAALLSTLSTTAATGESLAKPRTDVAVPDGTVDDVVQAHSEFREGDLSSTDSARPAPAREPVVPEEVPSSSSDGAVSRRGATAVMAASQTSSSAAFSSATQRVKIGRTWFEIVIYMTRDDEYDRLMAAEKAPTRVATMSSDMISAGAASASAVVPLHVLRGRPYLRREVGDAYLLGMEYITADPARTMIFACGPEELTTDATVVGAELGIPVHQEESYF